jgi:hypothetical protein
MGAGADSEHAGAVPDGPPDSEYPAAVGVALKSLGLAAVMLVLAGGVFAGVVRTERAFWLAALGAPLAVLLVAFALHQFLFPTRLGVYPTGVRVGTRFSTTFTRWEDVTGVLEQKTRGPGDGVFRAGFRRADGRTFLFSAERVDRLVEFAARLHREVDPRVRAATLLALAAGEVAWFGPVGLGREGFHSRNGVLAWDAVSHVGFDELGRFEILRKNSNWAWFSKPGLKVENVGILVELYQSRRTWAELSG